MKQPIKHLLTEMEIRQLLKKDETLRTLNILKGTLITPSAQEFLKMNSITINFTEGDEADGVHDTVLADTDHGAGYTGLHGEQLDTKPEELTHLHGNQLIEKDNPIIVFRGKLDKLCALILEAQLLGIEKENRKFVNDLQEILEFVRSLLPAEYNENLLKEFNLLGLSSKALRERSHNVQKYFGRGHLLMHHSMGALCLRLNLLRTAARETELAAVAAFHETRKDIVEALNRLSSLFYILIFKYLPKNYSPGGTSGI